MQFCSIDPGCNNFSISSQDLNTTFHINFGKFIFYLKFLKFVILSIVKEIEKLTNQNNFVFIVEKQLAKTSNIKYESHLCRCCKQLNIKIILIPAHIKNQICFENYNFFYKKIKTIKDFQNFIMTNDAFYEKLKDWSIYTLVYKFENIYFKVNNNTEFKSLKTKNNSTENVSDNTKNETTQNLSNDTDKLNVKTLDQCIESEKCINSFDFFCETIQKNFKIKRLANLLELKKFDDLIDTRLLLDARHTIEL
jgi:hypothetical protein